jgi:hypothetical protein
MPASMTAAMGSFDRPGEDRGPVVFETGIFLEGDQAGSVRHHELRAPGMTLVTAMPSDPGQQPGLILTFDSGVHSGRSHAGI